MTRKCQLWKLVCHDRDVKLVPLEGKMRRCFSLLLETSLVTRVKGVWGPTASS